jgi:hypothetical protein
MHGRRRELLAAVFPDHAYGSAVELRAQLLRIEQELVRRGLTVENVPLERFPELSRDDRR